MSLAPQIGIEVALLAVIFLAAATDLATRRIPNWITLSGFVLGVGLQGYYSGFRGTVLSLGGACLGLAFFMLLHLTGGMGAGDVKLAGAIGALVGPKAFILVFVFTGLLGGIAAIVVSVAGGRLGRTFAQSGQLLASFSGLRWKQVREKSLLSAPDALRLPYGAVLAAGALAFLAVYH